MTSELPQWAMLFANQLVYSVRCEGVETNHIFVDDRPNGNRTTCPGKQSSPLGDHPVHGTIKVDDAEGGSGVSDGNQGSHRAG